MVDNNYQYRQTKVDSNAETICRLKAKMEQSLHFVYLEKGNQRTRPVHEPLHHQDTVQNHMSFYTLSDEVENKVKSNLKICDGDKNDNKDEIFCSQNEKNDETIITIDDAEKVVKFM